VIFLQRENTFLQENKNKTVDVILEIHFESLIWQPSKVEPRHCQILKAIV
jgi:hypothetical protein